MIRNTKSRSITTSLIIGLILTVVLVSTIAISLSYFNASQMAKAQLADKAAEYEVALNQGLEIPLWNLDGKTIEHIGMSYAQNELVAELRIIDSRGTVYFDMEKEGAVPVVTRVSEVWHSGESIGYIEISLTSEYYQEINQQLLWASIFTIGINLLSLIIVIGFLLRRYLMKPLKQFSEIVSSYASGKYDAPGHYTSVREFQPIVTLLGEMGDRIKSQMTELRKHQEHLEESEQNFRNSLDNSPLGIRIVTEEGELLYGNQAILDIYGYSSVEELKATPAKKRYTPKSYAEHQERAQRRKLRRPIPSSYEISIVRKDGEIRHLIASRKAVVWGGEVQYQTIYQDITERRQAEEAIRENRDYLEKLTNSMWDIVFSVRMPERIIEWVNDSFNIIGYDPKECIGSTTEFLYSNKNEFLNVGNKLKNAIDAGQDILHAEQLMRRKSGEVFPVDIVATIIRDREGKVVSVTSIVRDITERKQAEEDVAKFKVIADKAAYGVSITNLEGQFIYVNESYAQMHGYTVDELVGRHFPILYTEKQAKFMEKLRKKVIQTGSIVSEEVWHRRKDGTVFPILVTGNVTRDDQGKPLYISATHFDLTERKKMQEQLVVTDRLASIGELISGIAHEMNNPLTGVIGFSDLLLDRDLPDDIKEDIEVINKEAKRTAEVVRGLLTFARKHPQEKQSVDINNIIQTVLELRAYEQRVHNIEVNTQFARNLPEITANGFQLQQVFINIIINAEHFMTEAHGRGTLTITTERIEDIIRASFADDGPGIAKENLGHLFDPFFTTKEVGKGTGLGLSISHGIVTEHGGRIYAESKLGKGATFIMELPIQPVATGKES